MLILAINPGSTSTKLALYDDENCVWRESVDYTHEQVSKYETIYDQYDMRIATIEAALSKHKTNIADIDTFVGRGGPAMPFRPGAYRLNPELVKVLSSQTKNMHISLLGGILAYNLANINNKPAFIYDPVTVDEFTDVARISGMKGIVRETAGHYLNIRAATVKIAQENNFDIKKENFILCHLGGGITVAIMKEGRIVDLVSDDEGPMSPERSGGVPLRQLIDKCYMEEKAAVSRQIRGSGGMFSYLGTTDLREVEKRIDTGDQEAKLIFDAMVYQIAKTIGMLAPVVCGKVTGIILTGGMAFSDRMTSAIASKVDFLGQVFIIPGENELESLAMGALRVLRGQEEANIL